MTGSHHHLIEKDDSAWAHKEGTLSPLPGMETRCNLSGSAVAAKPLPEETPISALKEPAGSEKESSEQHIHKPSLLQKLKGEVRDLINTVTEHNITHTSEQHSHDNMQTEHTHHEPQAPNTTTTASMGVL